MKILCVGDVHWSQYSSIIRRRGEFYSQRLENLLWSINWVEQTAQKQGVDKIIYLGDFFDRSDLNAEELTAFRDIIWAKEIPHAFIIGNHEVGNRSLEYSSIHFIEAMGPNFKVVDKPEIEVGFGYEFLYLPYIFENSRKPLHEYLISRTIVTDELKKIYVFSHNDLKGVNYGAFESKEGFDLEDIQQSCNLFINGHIHNGDWIVKNRILNLGNLTGQNFNEDGVRYPHHVLLLDTDQNKLDFLDNPYAFNFMKYEVSTAQDAEHLILPNHSVLSIKCPDTSVTNVREIMERRSEVEEYRIVSVASEHVDEGSSTVVFNTVDHLQQFQSYIIEQLGKTDAVVKELQEVLK